MAEYNEIIEALRNGPNPSILHWFTWTEHDTYGLPDGPVWRYRVTCLVNRRDNLGESVVLSHPIANDDHVCALVAALTREHGTRGGHEPFVAGWQLMARGVVHDGQTDWRAADG